MLKLLYSNNVLIAAVNFVWNLKEGSADRILSVDELQSLQLNTKLLVDMMEVSYGLDLLLYESDCISRHHMDAINSKKNDQRKIEKLLQIIQRRSYADYEKFIDCLRDPRIKQSHLADVIMGSGSNIH